MTDENLKEKYFIISRIILVLLFSIYGVFKQTGVSELILLLVLLFITTVTLKMVFDESKAKPRVNTQMNKRNNQSIPLWKIIKSQRKIVK